jgi:pseudomonalisin
MKKLGTEDCPLLPVDCVNPTNGGYCVFAKMKTALLCATFLAGAAGPALAALPAATPLVTGAVDDANVVTLAGDHAASAALAQDRGALDAAHVLPHVVLALKRPAALQAAFDKLVADQQKAGTADYHHWLTASQLRSYGPAQSDIDKVTSWVSSHGLTVNGVSPSGMSIDIGGRVDQLGAAFHTTLHSYLLKGETHTANVGDPSIPAALAPVVGGVTLSNFFPKPNQTARTPEFTIPNGGSPYYAVVPTDFATIYNLKPLLNGTSQFGTPITGAGVTIAVVEETNILAKDWNRFRKFFGLSGYSGTFSSLHPGGCGDPGRNGDEVEAAIDAEWSSAAAPDANIVEASCPSSETTFGVQTTLQNIVEYTTTPATILSISYGGCESGDGLSFLQAWSNLVEEGASEGLSIMVSSGDSGSSCDRNIIDSNGLGVNGLAANQYDTSVGGTDFYDTALGEDNTNWAKHKSGSGRGSALSYIPEIPWDNSCASSVLAKVAAKETGLEYCNSTSQGSVQNGVGGTGGASVYYSKPDWQPTSVLGVPNDGARDQPDISLFAANGIWGHFYLICMSDSANGGYPCQYKGTEAFNQAYGGTSVAAPAFAGIMALEAQLKALTGASPLLGNPAPRLYQLAGAQFGNNVLLKQCSSTLGDKISTGCIFNDVTAGNNAEACNAGTPDCYTNKKATLGVGVLRAQKGVNAYPATPGYDLATGIGTVNATNLLYNY